MLREESILISVGREPLKKLEGAAAADAEKADKIESGDENETETVKKVNENSASKPKVTPEDYIPLHFLSWLKLGPASDNQNPLWIPDTGNRQKKTSRHAVVL